MKTTVYGVIVALVFIISAGAHAFVGWPQAEEELTAAGVDAGMIEGLSIGWYWGSVAMLGFAGIVLAAVLRRVRRKPSQTGSLWVIALVYFAFGSITFVKSDYKPHFLLFVGTGVLVAVFAICAMRRPDAAPAS